MPTRPERDAADPLAKALPKVYGDKLSVDNPHQALDADGKPMTVLRPAHGVRPESGQRELDKQAEEKAVTRH